MRNHARCVTCNKVSSEDIETNPGDYKPEEFVPDPVDPLNYICKECKEWHEDLALDYWFKDDPYGWEEDGFLDTLELEIQSQPSNDNFSEK